MAIKGSRAVTKCTWVPATAKYYYSLLLPSYLSHAGVLLYSRLALNLEQPSYLSHHTGSGDYRQEHSPGFIFPLPSPPVLIPRLCTRLQGKDVEPIALSITLKTVPPKKKKKKQRTLPTAHVLKHRSYQLIWPPSIMVKNSFHILEETVPNLAF